MTEATDIVNYGIRLFGVLDPSLDKAADRVQKRIKQLADSNATAVERSAKAQALALASSLEANKQQAISYQKTVDTIDAQMKRAAKALTDFKNMEQTALRFKGGKSRTAYNQSKDILAELGFPEDLERRISKIQRDLTRFERIRKQLSEAGKPGSKGVMPADQRWFDRAQHEIEGWRATQQQLIHDLEKARPAFENYQKALHKLIPDAKLRKQFQDTAKIALVKIDTQAMDAQRRIADQKLQELLNSRKRIIDNALKKMGLGSPRLLEEGLKKYQVKSSAGEVKKSDETQLINLYARWQAKADQVRKTLAAIPAEIRAEIPALQQVEKEWADVGRRIEHELQVMVAMAPHRKAELLHLQQKARLLAQNQQFEKRQQNLWTGVSERGDGAASRGQLATLSKLIQDVRAAERAANQEAQNAIQIRGKEDHELKDAAKAYKELGDALSHAYVDQKKLREEIERTNRTQSRKNALVGAIGGYGGPLTRAFHGINAVGDLFRTGAAGGGGFLGGVGNVAGAAAGIAAILVPLKALSVGWNMAKGAANSFFNILHQGRSTIEGMISSSVAMHQANIQLALQMGMSIDEASRLGAVMKTLGLDTHWASVGLGTLNAEIVANNEAFTRWGIATRDAEGNARRVFDVVKDLSEVYRDLDEAGRQNFLADAQQALPFITMITPLITTDWDKLLGPLEEMNVILDETERKDLTRVVASVQGLRLAGEGLSNTVTTALAPAIQTLADAIITVLLANMSRIQNFFRGIAEEVKGFVTALMGMGNIIPITENFAEGMESTEEALTGAAGAGGLYADTLAGIDDEIDGTTGAIDDLNDAMEEQRDIIDDLRDSMEDELEVINDAKEAIKDGLELETEPLEENIELLEKRKEMWEKNKESALEAVDDEIKALEKQKEALEDAREKKLEPLEYRKKQLEAAKKALGDAPESTDTSALEDAAEAFSDQIDAIRDATDEWKDAQQEIIDGYDDQKDALSDQIEAIRDAAEARQEAAEAEIELLEEQIEGIEDVNDAAAKAAREQEYRDRRAYLMGQTLLAQLEARQRALSDRQARQRNEGESDIDYQLRIQQLDLQNQIDDENRRLELKELDEAHAIALANDERKEQIDLIRDQIEAKRDELKAQAKVDEATIKGIEDQKEAIDDLIEAIRDAIKEREKGDKAAIKGLEDQKEAVQDQIEAIRDADKAAKEAYDRQVDAIEEAIDKVQDKIDEITESYDDKIDGIEDDIEDWKDVAEGITDFYDGLIDPINEKLDSLKDKVKELKDAADDQIEALEDAAEAVRDFYEPQIKYHEDIIEGYQDQIRELQKINKELKDAKTNTEALRESQGKQKDAAKNASGTGIYNESVSPGGIGVSPDGTYGIDTESIGYKIGEYIREAILQPFKEKPFGEALLEVMGNLWDDVLKPILAEMVKQLDSHKDEAADLTYKVLEIFFIGEDSILSKVVEKLVKNFFVAMVKRVTGYDVSSIPGFNNAWGKVWDAIWIIAVEQMKKTLAPQTVLKEILDVIIKPLKSLKDEKDIGEAWNVFWEEALEAAEAIFGKLPIKLVEWIINKIKDFVDVNEKAKDAYWKPFWEEAIEAGAEVFAKLPLKLLDWILGPIDEFVTDKIRQGGRVTELAGDLWGSILSSGAATFLNIGTWLEDHIGSPIVTFFTELPGRIGEALGGIWGTISGPIQTAYNGFATFINGIGSVVSSIAGFVGISIPSWSLPQWTNPVVVNNGGSTVGANIPGGDFGRPFAMGGWVSKPTLAKIGEAGHDEVVLTTDPRHKKRTARLLGRFLKAFSDMGEKPIDVPIGGYEPMHAHGGPGDWVSAVGNFFGGLLDTGGDVLGAIKSAPGKLFELARDKAAQVFEAGINRLIDVLPTQPTMIRGAAGWARDKLTDWVRGRAYDKYLERALDAHKIFGNAFVEPTQGYGYTDFAMSGIYGGGPHPGVDIASAGGANIPLYGPGPATVVNRGSSGNVGLGNWIHFTARNAAGELIRFVLGHMAQMTNRSTGESIDDTTQIGNMGTTGNSRGVHTHVEAYNDAHGTQLNPEQFFPKWKSFWDLPGFARGGFIKPNSTLLDMFGRPYARAGEGGLLETVTPISFLQNAVRNAVDGSTTARLAAGVPAGGAAVGGNHFTLHIGEVRANTAADARVVADTIKGTFEDWLDKVPAYRKPYNGGRA